MIYTLPYLFEDKHDQIHYFDNDSEYNVKKVEIAEINN